MPEVLVDKQILKSFAVPSSLSPDNFQELASKAFVEELAAGKAIFDIGDDDGKSVYLVEGAVTITSASGKKASVLSGSEAAAHPLANASPRKHKATAESDCKIVRLDRGLLELLMTWDQMSGVQVDEIVEEDHDQNTNDDWMTRILQSKAFLQVPTANIQLMFMKMEEYPVKSGDVVIKQGEEGDFYYIIKAGQCKVTRSSKTGAELTLAKLANGDAFGEEALLSDTKRNANVKMTKDGVLMRLSRKDFDDLLKEPMLTWVTRAEGDQMVQGGEGVWVDVRLESEYKNNGIEGSVNIPLFVLRLKVATLAEDKKYILYCDTGSRSSAAAFLLSERGLEVACLKGGLNSGK